MAAAMTHFTWSSPRIAARGRPFAIAARLERLQDDATLPASATLVLQSVDGPLIRLPMTADDEAREHERRRVSIERRIARVEEAIAQWHAWEADRFLPDAQQRTVAKPDLPLDECLDLRRMLLAELARLGPA